MALESLRISQVDANILDSEYRKLISEQLEQLIIEIPSSIARLIDFFKPELHVMLNGILWTTRILRGCSPGQMEMNISYKGYSHDKIYLHFFFSVIVPYLSRRLCSLLGRPLLTRVFTKTLAVFEILCIFHYLNFLRIGEHSTPVESILNLRSLYNSSINIGTVNYDLQNRELLWHTFRDALLLIWPAYTMLLTKLTSRKPVEQSTFVALRCGSCSDTAIVPMRACGCGHIACYCCVTSRKPIDMTKCTICGKYESIVPVFGTLLSSRRV